MEFFEILDLALLHPKLSAALHLLLVRNFAATHELSRSDTLRGASPVQSQPHFLNWSHSLLQLKLFRKDSLHPTNSSFRCYTFLADYPERCIARILICHKTPSFQDCWSYHGDIGPLWAEHRPLHTSRPWCSLGTKAKTCIFSALMIAEGRDEKSRKGHRRETDP